jgi:acetylornithine deacetylase/succinyl-diaminopimelate desuccinylase-like protein
MVPVLDRVFNKMGQHLPSHPDFGKGSITVTNVVCRPGALSIIPDECEISIDRRYVPGEGLESILGEFEHVLEKIKEADPEFEADARVRTFIEKSYTGYEKQVKKHHPVWMTEKDHPFVKKVLKALERIGQNPEIGYWQFGTDGSMTAGLMGVPTIGYSGAEEHYAHTSQEMVNIEKMMQSLEGYLFICCELFEIDISELDRCNHS